MKNLLKNTFRSFKKNKLTIITLTFLTFLATGIYTLLSSITANVLDTYTSFVKKGNLHDFTISENYTFGDAQYELYLEPKDLAGESDIIFNSMWVGTSSDGKSIPWLDASSESSTTYNYTHTWHFVLNEKKLNANQDSLWKLFFDDTNPETSMENRIVYQQWFSPTIITYGQTGFDYLNGSNNRVTSVSYHDIMGADENGGVIFKSSEWTEVSSETIKVSNDFIEEISTRFSPMQNFLTSEMKNEVDTRKYRSLNISNSPDSIYYKIVQTEPKTNIDKLLTFPEIKETKYFSSEDFDPLYTFRNSNTYLTPVNYPISSILSHKFSSVVPPVPGTDEYAIANAKFKILLQGSFTDDEDTSNFTGYPYLKRLGETNNNQPFGTEDFAYYVNTLQPTEYFTDYAYRYNIGWKVGKTPENWYLINWTSFFTYLAPQYAQNNNIAPVDLNNLTKNNGADLLDYFNGNFQTSETGNSRKSANKQIEEYMNDFCKNNPTNIVVPGTDSKKLGGVPYVVLDYAITPDFLYPIVGLDKPVPNFNNQAILYTNSVGWERVYGSFRSSEIEEYLVGVFKKTNSQKILDRINREAEEIMHFPKGIVAATMANDTTNLLNASAFRIAYIPALVSGIQTISYLLTGFVLFLSFVVITIVITRYIQGNRKIIGIMRANGIRKKKIVFSLIPFSLIPTIFGGVAGYITGLFLQSVGLALIKNYWTLPSRFVSFDWISFLTCIVVPFLLFSLIVFLIAILILRSSTVELMKSGSEFKVNLASKIIKKPLKNINIFTRLRASIIANSIGRLLFITIVTSITFSSLVFATATSGKITEAKSLTFNSRNYKYAVDLYTPTTTGGQYLPTSNNVVGQSGAVDLTEQGEGNVYVPNSLLPLTISNNGDYDNFTNKSPLMPESDFFSNSRTYNIEKYYYNSSLRWACNTGTEVISDLLTSSATNVLGNIFLPTADDGEGNTIDLFYLKNRTLSKELMNYNVGLPMAGMQTNPWNVALSLMPENQKNSCNTKAKWLINEAGKKTFGQTPYDDDVSWSKYKVFFYPEPVYDDESGTYLYTIDKSKVLAKISIIPVTLPVSLDFAFINFLVEFYSTQWIKNELTNELEYASNYDFQISQNIIPLMDEDETYTYLDVSKVKNSIPIEDNTHILGIKVGSNFLEDSKNTNYLNLVNAEDENLLPLLAVNPSDIIEPVNPGATKTKTVLKKDAQLPVIINEYASYKYGLNVGDKFTIKLNNKANRYDATLNEGYAEIHTTPDLVTFTIKGICSTRNKDEFFINQDLANYLLGLKSHLEDDYGNLNNVESLMIDYKEFAPNVGFVTWADADTDKASRYKIYNLSNNSDVPAENPMYNYATIVSNKINMVPYGYNGVFTNSTTGSFLANGMFLYSPSGIYPASDKVSSGSVAKTIGYGANALLLARYLLQFFDANNSLNTAVGNAIYKAYQIQYVTGQNADWASNSLKSFDNTLPDISIINWLQEKVKGTWGDVTVVNLTQNASVKDAEEIVITTLTETIQQIEYTILSTIVLMCVLIIILITLLIIQENRTILGILSALGNGTKKNLSIVLAIYLPIILLAFLLTIPFSYLLLFIYNSFIFGAMNIFVPTVIYWWQFIASFGFLLLIFVFAGICGYRIVKKDKVVNAIKTI